MTVGEQLYDIERGRALTDDGVILPPWCDLPAEERVSWIQRGLSEMEPSEEERDRARRVLANYAACAVNRGDI